MKKAFFKVRVSQCDGGVILNIPATEVRLFQLVYDCMTSECSIEVLAIHDQELLTSEDNLSYGD